VGAVLWVNDQRWFVEEQNFGELFLWSGTSAVIGLLIGGLISLFLIKSHNAKDVDGINPLHYATWTDHKETVELLITKGADVNAKNNHGETPLDVAILLNQPETADLLRKHGGKTGEELKAAGN